MTTHDPYTGAQITFERTDRTGRYSPLVDDVPYEPWWFAVAGGVAVGVLIALAVWAAL